MPALHTDSHVFSRVLGRPLPVVARAKGVEVWDTDGRRYLDGAGGAVVVNVGHGREEVAAAIGRQAATAGYVHGTQFTSDALEEYARRVATHTASSANAAATRSRRGRLTAAPAAIQRSPAVRNAPAVRRWSRPASASA